MLAGTTAALADHIDSYWLFERDAHGDGLPPVYEFPSLAPELMLCLRGQLRFVYGRTAYCLHRSTMFGHLHARMVVHLGDVDAMIVVRFASRGVSSVLPFIGADALLLTRHPFLPAPVLFGEGLHRLEESLAGRAAADVAARLDTWFLGRLNRSRCGMVTELGPSLDAFASVESLVEHVGASHSTVARHFKRETGLTPKRFLMRNRLRRVLAEVFETRSTDWMDFVYRYGYHDQSHFIKEVRRFTGFTPEQLLRLPVLADHRPHAD
jgi:AraC-like DNA-binding protein